MYVMDNLTQSDWAKIQPGMRNSLYTAQNLDPNVPIAQLDWQNKINSDIWVKLQSGRELYLPPRFFPSNWTKAEWIDYIVTLAKNPLVTRVGTLTEMPFSEAPWTPLFWGAKTENSPQALLYDIQALGVKPPSGTSPGGGPPTTATTTSGISSSFPMIALLVGGGLILYTIMRRR